MEFSEDESTQPNQRKRVEYPKPTTRTDWAVRQSLLRLSGSLGPKKKTKTKPQEVINLSDDEVPTTSGYSARSPKETATTSSATSATIAKVATSPTTPAATHVYADSEELNNAEVDKWVTAKRVFRLKGTKPIESGGPILDDGEKLTWILASACDFAEVNALAERRQLERAEGNETEVLRNRSIIIKEGNRQLDLKTHLIIARYNRAAERKLMEKKRRQQHELAIAEAQQECTSEHKKRKFLDSMATKTKPKSKEVACQVEGIPKKDAAAQTKTFLMAEDVTGIESQCDPCLIRPQDNQLIGWPLKDRPELKRMATQCNLAPTIPVRNSDLESEDEALEKHTSEESTHDNNSDEGMLASPAEAGYLFEDD